MYNFMIRAVCRAVCQVTYPDQEISPAHLLMPKQLTPFNLPLLLPRPLFWRTTKPFCVLFARDPEPGGWGQEWQGSW